MRKKYPEEPGREQAVVKDEPGCRVPDISAAPTVSVSVVVRSGSAKTPGAEAVTISRRSPVRAKSFDGPDGTFW